MNVHSPLPAIGHNIPPEFPDLDQKIRDGLDIYENDARARLAEVPNVVITDEDSAGLATTLGKVLADLAKSVDAKRDEIKRPFLNAGRSIDDSFRKLKADLDDGVTKIKKLIGVWQDSERRRQAAEAAKAAAEAEEARRLAAEAEAQGNMIGAADLEDRAATAARAADEIMAAPSAIRSDYGHTASARKTYVGEITDITKAFKTVKDVPAVREVIQKAVNALVRAGNHTIPGVNVVEQFSTTLR